MKNPPHIIAATEVKPKNNRFPLVQADYMISGYQSVSKNIDTDRGRGLVIWTLSTLETCEVDIETDYQESVWISLSLKRSVKVLIGCIYRSPNSTPENTVKLNSLIEKAEGTEYTHLLIVGDFNYPTIDWENEATRNKQEEEFLESCRNAYLHQHVLRPTRGRIRQASNILDLVLTREEETVTDLAYHSPLGKSDHACLHFKLRYPKEKSSTERKIFMYHRGDYQSMKDEFNMINWDRDLNGKTPEEMYQVLSERYHSACQNHIPTKTIAQGKKRVACITTEEAKLCELF